MKERDEREEREMKQPSNIHLYLASQFKKQSKLPFFMLKNSSKLNESF